MILIGLSVKRTIRYGQKSFSKMLDSKPRLDRDARREAILDVARDIFLAEGFAAASMSMIAAKLGGSKGTLYNYFKSKDELFAAYVTRHCMWQSEAMFGDLRARGDIESSLIALGTSYLKLVLSDFSQANFRLIVAEAQRWPEVGRIFYESGPMNGVSRLAGFLEDAAARGQLRVDDPIRAAQQFLGLCNHLQKARQCNYMPEPTDEQIAVEVNAAVKTFMSAFGPKDCP